MLNEFLKLELPHIIKNNPALCQFLNRAYHKHKDSITATEKELSRYCNWHKQGHKYVITKVFEEVKEKEDNRKYNGSESKYSEIIDELMLMLLASYNVKERKNAFYEVFKMFNVEYYYDEQNRVQEIAEEKEVPLWILDDYFLRVGGFMNNTLKGCIDRLIKKESIEFLKIMMCFDNTEEDKKPREMILLEIEQYTAIKESVAKELGIYNKVIPPSMSISYWTKVKEEAKRFMDLNSIWTIWDITQGEQWMTHVPLLPQSDPDKFNTKYSNLKIELNKILCESIIANAKNRIFKAIDLKQNYKEYEYDFGCGDEIENKKAKYSKNKNKYDLLIKHADNYIRVYEELTNDLIKTYDILDEEYYP